MTVLSTNAFIVVADSSFCVFWYFLLGLRSLEWFVSLRRHRLIDVESVSLCFFSYKNISLVWENKIEKFIACLEFEPSRGGMFT